MDASVASLVKPTAFLCSVPFPSCYPTFPTKFSGKPAARLMDCSVTFLKLPSGGSSTARRRAKLQVFSLLRRPARRRNSLREKLIPGNDQVPLFSELSNSECNLGILGLRQNESNGHGLGMDLDEAKEQEGGGDSKKFDFSGNSLLWDELDKWKSQYKEDSEFWGIGTGPIFTIFQGSDGNVTRVSVNDDEILRRNRIQALSLEVDKESGELKDVNSKISRARVVAKEIELGAYHMPKNSSIAKFVVDGNKSSLVGLIHAFSSRRESLIRIFPAIGLMILCSFCVLGAARKLFVGYNEVKMTREEAEMLRRKKKSRIEREKLQRGKVEVLQNGDELPVIPGTKPQLDRDELMKNIVQANKSRDTLALSDPLGHITAKDHDFDKKVAEIRDMVRKVRKVELQNQSLISHAGEQDDSTSIVVNTQFERGGFENQAVHEEKSAKESVCSNNAAKTSSHTGLENNTVDCMDVKGMDILDEEMTIFIDEISHGKPFNNFGVSINNDFVDIDEQETSIQKKSQKTLVGIDITDSGAPDAVSLSNREEVKMDKVDNNSVRGEQTNKPLSVTSNNKIGTLRIITSLKEANEYLSTKGKFPKGSVQQEQPIHSKRKPKILSNYVDRSDGKLHRIRETAKASGFATDFKLHANDDNAKKISVESKHAIKKNLAFQNEESNGGAQKVINADVAADLDNVSMIHNEGIKLDRITLGTKIHNETRQQFKNQNNCDHTSRSKQVAKSQDIQSDYSLFSDNLDQVDDIVLKNLLNPEEHDIHHDRNLLHVAEIGRSDYVITLPDAMTNETNAKKDMPILKESKVLRSSEPYFKLEIKQSSVSTNSTSNFEKYRDNDNSSQSNPVRSGSSVYSEAGTINTLFNSISEPAFEDLSSKANISSYSSISKAQNDKLPKTYEKSWVEENFQQFDSIIEKIGTGFKDNFKLAKIKAQDNSLSSSEISKLGLWGEDEELEWMKDENLLEIVYQVRDNELAGRDPFYLMDADDQQAFFRGLERKAEKVNEKLAGVHEWIHSKIENLDYGADGIGLNDPLEKIIPHWKGLPIDQDPEFLKKFLNIGNSVLAENIRNLDHISKGKHECFQKSENIPNSDSVSPFSPVNNRINLSKKGASTTPKTLIECSDGSSRPGKKKSKEYWQHTKKWSQGFLEVYNAETNPEVKSILKDIGKDLDRWITDKEIKDVADLMTRIPKKKRRYIEKKINKVKREVEKYGSQAVVSKYKEYADEKEEDYLWWLDLQFVLCIEIYCVEDDVPRIGFYSLEMAEDLELNPKQFHVIAFEDTGDSKNFCYILQAQMDMLGNGKAFAVARPPKDAFREAKANGFSITLIRKGEMRINVDQTLEEVEEELKELGSKIYHDKIMNERGVDIRSLMRGVITANKSGKSRRGSCSGSSYLTTPVRCLVGGAVCRRRSLAVLLRHL